LGQLLVACLTALAPQRNTPELIPDPCVSRCARDTLLLHGSGIRCCSCGN